MLTDQHLYRLWSVEVKQSSCRYRQDKAFLSLESPLNQIKKFLFNLTMG